MSTTSIYLQNNVLDLDLHLDSNIPAKDRYFNGSAPFGEETNIGNCSRSSGITDGKSFIFNIRGTLGNVDFIMCTQLIGTAFDSDMTNWLEFHVFGRTEATGKMTDHGTEGVGIAQPLINGESLNIHFTMERYGTLGGDNIKVTIGLTSQSSNAEESIVSRKLTTKTSAGESENAQATPPSIYRDPDAAPPPPDKPLAHRVDPKVYPYNAIGQIKYTFDGKEWFACSATLISPDTILTAAHCIYDFKEKAWAEQLEFTPQRSPSHTSPVYKGTKMFAVRAFIEKDDYRYDVATVKLASEVKDIKPLPISCMTPYKNGPWKSVGYPSKPSYYPGGVMYEAEGPYVKGTDILIMGHNDMADGCSGGPWLKVNGPNAVVNGVNSQKDRKIGPTEESSSYFGTAVYSLAYLAQL